MLTLCKTITVNGQNVECLSYVKSSKLHLDNFDNFLKITRELQDRQAGRQAGRQTDRQTCGQTEMQTDRQVDRQAGRQVDSQPGRQTGRQTEAQTEQVTDRTGYTQTDRQKTHRNR